MSSHAWIDFELNSPNRESQAQAVAALLASGWSLGKEGQVHILSVGDDDSFDWRELPASSFYWPSYLAEKIRLGETAGLTLLYDDTQAGVDLLCWKEGGMSFSLSTNTVYLDNLRCPDFSWYMARLLPVLAAEVSSVRCEMA